MSYRNPKNTKSTGTFRVTDALGGPFDASSVRLRDRPDGTLQVRGLLQISATEQRYITLVIESKPGDSSGQFNGDDEVPFSYYAHRIDNVTRIYDSEKGTFKVTFIPTTEHATGTVHFTSTVSGVQTEFIYDFNIRGFDN